MKRYLAFVFACVAIPAAVCAQAPAMPSDQPAEMVESAARNADPSALAMRESQKLQKTLGLDAKQTKKVYKLFYKHFKSETPSFGRPGGMGPHPGGMGGRGGFGGPGGMPGGAGRPEGPARNGMHGPGSGASEGLTSGDRPAPADMGELREKAEAWKKEQAKKFRKIFSAEQYAAWEKMTAQPQGPHMMSPADPENGSKAPRHGAL